MAVAVAVASQRAKTEERSRLEHAHRPCQAPGWADGRRRGPHVGWEEDCSPHLLSEAERVAPQIPGAAGDSAHRQRERWAKHGSQSGHGCAPGLLTARPPSRCARSGLTFLCFWLSATVPVFGSLHQPLLPAFHLHSGYYFNCVIFIY